ncbi:hypothetical protein M408DRAFT_159595 [Serendipita vermifera MAFF 305830]|uniref:Uncharacterized protein n=1 Tax=Serendipita vermifera MAFF 305830 TaxID=933852 RepID=A0A0C3ATC8_SERVB|nr:hypothetical protein M408DRAFT_159595 [Serendipita vermifera MAFF 305830]
MSGLYSGLGSPPPYTNTFASISDASLTAASGGSSGPNTPAIIGAVFGILIGITLCIFAALCYRRRRNRQRIAPSTAFMNYRSTTEQPPAYQFNRTSFFQRTRSGFGGGFGADSKSGYPHPFAPAAGVAGLGYGATAAGSGVGMGAGGRRLMTLDEKSTEGRESALSGPTFGAMSYEDQQLLGLPAQANMGGFAGVGSGGGSVAPVVPEPRNDPMTSMEGVARTLTPPPSNASDKFGSTSSIDQNPYDGLAPPTPAPGFPTNPFGTPPASDSNLAGKGAWSQA